MNNHLNGASGPLWWAGLPADATRPALTRDESVDEIGRVAESEGIECGFHKGGTLVVARNRAQAARGRAQAQDSGYWGTGTTWLEACAEANRLAVPGLCGATFNPNCARIQPFKLALGPARAVEDKGARIYEKTRVAQLDARLAVTDDDALVKARHIIRATEAWTARLPGLRRTVALIAALDTDRYSPGGSWISRIPLAIWVNIVL